MQSLEVEAKWGAGRREREVTGRGESLLVPAPQRRKARDGVEGCGSGFGEH